MGLVPTVAGGALLVVAAYHAARRLARLAPPAAALAAVALALAAYAGAVLAGLAPVPGLDEAALHAAAYGLTGYAAALLGKARARRAGGGRLHPAPVAIVAFLGVVVAANVVFVLVAERGLPAGLAERLLPAPRGGGRVEATGFPGALTRGSARRPLAHRARLEALARQRALGWRIEGGWERPPRAGEAAVFVVEARGPDGAPLEGARVEARFVRPGAEGLGRALALAAAGGGRYHGRVALAAPGRWEVTVVVRRGGERFELRGETWVLDGDGGARRAADGGP